MNDKDKTLIETLKIAVESYYLSQDEKQQAYSIINGCSYREINRSQRITARQLVRQYNRNNIDIDSGIENNPDKDLHNI